MAFAPMLSGKACSDSVYNVLLILSPLARTLLYRAKVISAKSAGKDEDGRVREVGRVGAV